ncbi:MAG TPA: hypothetical protein VE685_27110 [Thermoanaerobaculia bacterium]|nr:hypothetical protein [Thermoanaerobaculia bacterium]
MSAEARPRWLLAALGLVSAGAWAWLAFAFPATSARRDVLTFLAIVAGLFLLSAAALPAARGRSALRTILLFAALFRGLLLFAGLPPGPAEETWSALRDDLSGRRIGYSTFLLYDDDVWRYLWDGHVTAAGLDPYARSPWEIRDRYDEGRATPAEEVLLDGPIAFDVLDQVRFGSYGTIYPPLAQILFRMSNALAPGSVFAWKLVAALFDLGTCVLLARLLVRLGRGPEACVLYAWSPLAIKEIAGSGHVDAVMVFLLVLAAERALAGRDRASLAAYGASILAKLATIPAAGLFLRRAHPRAWWVLPAVGGGLALPFWRGLPDLAANLSVFGREWAFNTGPWLAAVRTFEALGMGDPEAAAHLVTKAAALVLAVLVTLRVDPADDRRWILGLLVVLAGLTLLNAAVMPWYLLWALPFAVAAGVRSWEVLAALSFLSYLVYCEHAERAWWLWVEYGGLAVAAAVELTVRPGLRRDLAALVLPLRSTASAPTAARPQSRP